MFPQMLQPCTYTGENGKNGNGEWRMVMKNRRVWLKGLWSAHQHTSGLWAISSVSDMWLYGRTALVVGKAVIILHVLCQEENWFTWNVENWMIPLSMSDVLHVKQEEGSKNQKRIGRFENSGWVEQNFHCKHLCKWNFHWWILICLVLFWVWCFELSRFIYFFFTERSFKKKMQHFAQRYWTILCDTNKIYFQFLYELESSKWMQAVVHTSFDWIHAARQIFIFFFSVSIPPVSS